MQSMLAFDFVYIFVLGCSFLTFDRLAVLKSVKIFVVAENFEKQLTKQQTFLSTFE